jgi:hypothetical protein
MIYEPSNRLEVSTPKGDGVVWLVTDYGHETDTIYTIIINDTGELWQFCHKDIIVKPNITFRSGVKGPMKDEKGRPTRKALALRKWNC